MILSVEELVLERQDGVPLLGPLSLGMEVGERLGLVGESGSGKSLLVRALFHVLPAGVHRKQGRIKAFGIPMEHGSPQRDRIRGARMAWVPQDPLTALNPYLPVRDLVTLLPRAQRKESRAAALHGVLPLMDRLRLPTDREFLARRPQELSGGQRQRIMLAQALACNPELLILDEPTTALDPTVQAGFVGLVRELQQERSLACLWISHDLPVVATVSDRLLVLYGGHLVEAGPTSQVLRKPRHPYTARLLGAARNQPSGEAGLLQVPGQRPAGCPYLDRCARVGRSCADWKPWSGTPETGFRCESPL